MTKNLAESIIIINANFIFVLVLAFTGIWIAGGSATAPACFILILSFIVTPAIYGRFIDLISGNRTTPLTQLFRMHWLNFYAVVFSLSIPIFIFILVSQLLVPFEKIIFSVIVRIFATTLHIILIYITPMIFIKKENFTVVPVGMKYLSTNFKKTLPLIGISVFASIFTWAATVFKESSPLFSADNIFFVVAFAFFHNLILTYLNLMVLLSAGITLIRDPDAKSNLNPF